MARRHIISHTALRGIAALLVVFYHLQFGENVRLGWESATPFFTKGYLWVDLFFLLSGFVIAYSAQADEKAPYDWPQVRRFWAARFARIYPLHLVCLLAMLLLQAGLYWLGVATGKPLGEPARWTSGSWLNFVEQLFLLNGWGLTGRIGWNIPSWSISAEATAYLLFPLLAAMLVRGGRIALLLFIAAATGFYGWVAATTGVLDIVKGLAILRCLAGFSLGMVLFMQRAWFERLPDSLLTLMQATGLALALATLLLGLNDVIAIPGFFLLVAATWPDRGWLARPLAMRPLVWLGEISYSVYLVHVVLLEPWVRFAPTVFARLGLTPLAGRSCVVAGALLLVLFVAALTYRHVELPARKRVLRWFEARRGTMTPPSMPVAGA